MYQALIVAAGAGLRSGLGYNKNLYQIKGKPLLLYSVDRFRSDNDCEGIVVVCPAGDIDGFRKLIGDDVTIVSGGDTRQKSVALGLAKISAKHVLIHDGARPNLKAETLARIKQELNACDALTLAINIKDTLKVVENDRIIGDIDREKTVLIQTPQAFLTEKIKLAHALAESKGNVYSDDTSLIQHELKEVVKIIQGNEDNIKATTKADFDILEALL